MCALKGSTKKKSATTTTAKQSSSSKLKSFDVIAQSKTSTKLGMAINPEGLCATSLRFAGPIMFTGMQIASVKTAYGIHKAKDTGDLSPLPFTSLAVNCLVWSLYGLLKKDLTVLIPNVNGIVLGLIGMVTYHKYATNAPKKLYGIGAALCAAAFKLFLDKDTTKIGLIGCSLAVVLCGSPLATLGTVLKDKSTASLPFMNSFTTWLNALCWFSYGILVAHDVMIFGPNGMGLALASIQMLMFMIFGMPPKK